MDADEKYKKVFSKNLNFYMQLRGKTQTDIVTDLGINKSAISSWCNGTRLPRMNKVNMLANYLGIHFSKLIGTYTTESTCKLAVDNELCKLIASLDNNDVNELKRYISLILLQKPKYDNVQKKNIT